MQSTEHRQLSSRSNAKTVNLSCRGLAQPPRQHCILDQRDQGGTPPGTELFTVGQTGIKQACGRHRIELHSSREHRTKQTAATHFIDPCHPWAAGQWSGQDTPAAERRRRRRRGSSSSSDKDAAGSTGVTGSMLTGVGAGDGSG